MAGRNLIVRDVVCRIAVAASLPVLGAIAAEDFSDAAMAVEANRLQTESAARSWDLGAPIAGDRVAETRRLQDAVRAGSDPRGNPLWATRLESLVATRERPLLIPSRRPPAPPVSVAAPPALATVPPVAQPEPFRLALIGAVAAASEGIAVFRDEASKDVVRLRTGERHAGWMLRSVNGRQVTVEKGAERIRLALSATADDGVVREIRSPARSRNAGAPPPSPLPVGGRAPAAVTVAAAADGSAPPALPPFIGQAPPAVAVPGAVVPPSDGSAVPALPPFIDRAPPAVPLAGAVVPPSDGSAPPALPPFIDRAPPATDASAPTKGGGSSPALPPGINVVRPD